MDIEETVEQNKAFLKEAKAYLKQNTGQDEYWVDHDGNLHPVPDGMWFDAKADTLRFKK